MEKKSKPVVKQAKDKVPDENPDFWVHTILIFCSLLQE